MDHSIKKFEQQIVKKAIVMDIGGFRPTEDPMTSWFGRVTHALPGESWPHQDGQPMHALAQVNLIEFPHRPKGLEDVDFITLFIGPKRLPVDDANGTNWLIRTYNSIDELVPLQQHETGSRIKAFPMRPRLVDNDYPCWEDLPVAEPDTFGDDDYFEYFENVGGFKFGGWPTLIQSEVYWAPNNNHPARPEYVFQIDSTDKGKWSWGDGGVGYFGRGTAAGQEDQWVLCWQCY